MTAVERVTGADTKGTSHLVGQRELDGAVRPGAARGDPCEPADGGLLARPEVAHPQDAAGRQLRGADLEVGAGRSRDGRPEHTSQRLRQRGGDPARRVVDARRGVCGAGRRVRLAGAVGGGDGQLGGRIGLRDDRSDGHVRPVGEPRGHRDGERDRECDDEHGDEQRPQVGASHAPGHPHVCPSIRRRASVARRTARAARGTMTATQPSSSARIVATWAGHAQLTVAAGTGGSP